MTSEPTSVPVVRRWVIHRRSHILIWALLGVLLGGAVAASAALTLTAEHAIFTSVEGDQAGRRFAIQTGDPATASTLGDLTGFSPVKDSSGSLLAPDREVPVTIRATREPGLPLGNLLRGERATAPLSVTVSRAAAEALDVDIGDRVALREPDLTRDEVVITGITVNSGNVGELSVVLSDPALRPAEASVWLSDRDPYEVADLRQSLDAYTATFRTVANLADDARTQLPAGLGRLRHLPLGLGFLLTLMLTGLAATMWGTVRFDVAALVGAGVSQRRAWGYAVRIATVTLVVAELIGAGMALAVMRLVREPLSGLFGQYWMGVEVPWAHIVVVVGLTAATGASWQALRSGGRWLRSKRPTRAWSTGRVWGLGVVPGLLLLVLAGVSRLGPDIDEGSRLAPLGAVLLAASLPSLIFALVRRTLPLDFRRLGAHLGRGLQWSCAVAGVVAVLSASHVARANHDTLVFQGESGALQPSGSMLILDVPTATADALVREYASLGGAGARQLKLADETRHGVRVSSSGLVDCLDQAGAGANPNELPETCYPQGSRSPINIVALDDHAAAPSADGGLVEGSTVGLLVFKAQTDDVSRTGRVRASADASLGGNMPGLVIPEDSELAKEYGLVASGNQLVALTKFRQLSEADRAHMRARVAQLAPAAQVSEATGDEGYARQRAIGVLVALLGTGLCGLVLLLGGLGTIAGERETLRVLAELSPSQARRARLVMSNVGAALLCVTLSVALGFLSAYLSSLAGNASFGRVWLAPGLGGLVACLILAGLFLRVPRRVD
ncbi:hypothetical protein [Nocardioides gilvus]|uniref:hypothetical protein n=1 Tax=Nocardioides gilvus TaxID=1735589 RepID=UPI0013A53C73|nr:hypothetical protein [Nocardioides gilvus]